MFSKPIIVRHFVIGTIVAFSIVASTFAMAENRSLDGSGNNVAQPNQGAADVPFIRTTRADYEDGVSQPNESGRRSAREVSNLLGSQKSSLSGGRLSSLAWQWGQFVDHDIALTETHASETFSVMVTDPSDPLFPVIPMARSNYDSNSSTVTPRQQLNSTSSYIDASMVYATNQTRADALRSFSGGRMKTSAGDLMPFNTNLLDNANDSGIQDDATLFLAGDRRANEQPGLTAMHTLFVREHNRLADNLAAQNPTWLDEQIYQHARRLVGGMVQSVTYNEFLPAVMGSYAPVVTAYDSSMDATLSNEFATAAFRFGHTQVTDHLMRINASGISISGGAVSMADAFFRPSLISQSEDVDAFLNGLRFQVQNATDLEIVDDLRNMLFGNPGAGGMDLFALNVQRGRDHGIPSYGEAAEHFGLDAPQTFAELTTIESAQEQLAMAYDSVDDVDLWVGLLAENHMEGSEFGLLMNLILQDEFTRLMEGDRFFYAWDQELSATEIAMIQDTRLSDIISRNTGISSMSGNFFMAVAVPEPGSLALLAAIACFGSVRRRKRTA